jgi:hypothetical protein
MAGIEVDQIIDATVLSGRENIVFCLGPFARRVSFSAQQHRALNLVWALWRRKVFNKGDPVAVIGGGIAGLTAAAGLIAYECAVDVFEANSVTVAKQRYTDHRLVHPTVNQWPLTKLSMTTRLPFLEWFSGKCSEVATGIATQYEELRGSNRLLTDHRVVDISDLATGLVYLKTSPHLQGNHGYRLVIIAIGFGEEASSAPFQAIDYWFPDGLETLRDTKKAEDFLISGCGDGGLIDSLRVLHQGFQRGQLAFDVAAELADTELAAAIARAESEARIARTSDGLGAIYEGLAEILDTSPDYEVVATKLRASLEKSSMIYLIDRDLEAPYSLNAAPIHKLMIAHARIRGQIIYRRAVAALEHKEVHFAGKRIPAPPASHVIIRHGPAPAFGRLLTDDEIVSLRARQSVAPDALADPLWPDPFPTPPSLPVQDLNDLRFVESRVPLATRAIRSIVEDADIMPLAGRLRAIYGGAVPASAPTELFGIPVENTIRPKVMGIGG